MLTAIKNVRKMGFDVAPLMEGLSYSEASLDAGQALVPWDCAATFLNRLELQLSDAQVEALCLAHVQSHPLIRILAQFAASTSAWLDLFWKVSATFTEAQRVCVYSIEPGVHRLEVRAQDGLRPCRMWFVLTHHISRYASVLTGDEPLQVRSVEVSSHHLIAHYAPPIERGAVERLARTSEIPLGLVLDSLSILGASLGEFVRLPGERCFEHLPDPRAVFAVLDDVLRRLGVVEGRHQLLCGRRWRGGCPRGGRRARAARRPSPASRGTRWRSR